MTGMGSGRRVRIGIWAGSGLLAAAPVVSAATVTVLEPAELAGGGSFERTQFEQSALIDPAATTLNEAGLHVVRDTGARFTTRREEAISVTFDDDVVSVVGRAESGSDPIGFAPVPFAGDLETRADGSIEVTPAGVDGTLTRFTQRTGDLDLRPENRFFFTLDGDTAYPLDYDGFDTDATTGLIFASADGADETPMFITQSRNLRNLTRTRISVN